MSEKSQDPILEGKKLIEQRIRDVCSKNELNLKWVTWEDYFRSEQPDREIKALFSVHILIGGDGEPRTYEGLSFEQLANYPTGEEKMVDRNINQLCSKPIGSDQD